MASQDTLALAYTPASPYVLQFALKRACLGFSVRLAHQRPTVNDPSQTALEGTRHWHVSRQWE